MAGEQTHNKIVTARNKCYREMAGMTVHYGVNLNRNAQLIGLTQFWLWMMDLLKREDPPWTWVVPSNRFVTWVE